ncbi:MAG: hypothetical protein QM535_12890 [Limnohabitans sp.]|nr:hypothetical protein [Limnohabitans sp.]
MTNKEKAIALIKTIETRSLETLEFVNAEKFIHHTVRKPDGITGLTDFLMAAPENSATATPVRVIEDGEYVFLHTDFDFYGPHIGFDVMRFEEGKVVEMWDCIQPTAKPNQKGYSMIDGETEITDLDKTEENKNIVKNFVTNVLIDKQIATINEYVNKAGFIEHNPNNNAIEIEDNLGNEDCSINYKTIHKIIGQGNFILTISEGFIENQHTAFFDLFRLEKGKIIEHWDVIESIAPKEEWKNTKGRF